MFCNEIASKDFPFLLLHKHTKEDLEQLCKDTGQSMVVILDEEEAFVGIASLAQLDAVAKSTLLSELQSRFIKVAVKSTDYFLVTLSLLSEGSLCFVPVVDQQNKCCGVVTKDCLLQNLNRFLNTQSNGIEGLIVLQMNKIDYSFVELARIIESNNATILQLNTYQDEQSNLHYICLKLNRAHIADIMSALQRYSYQIVYFNGKEQYENELMQNYSALMNYLNI